MSPVVVAGSGPAGLMAADVIASAGVPVVLYERLPSLGRKLLMAGRGGLNLTHSEPLERLLGRYGAARSVLEPLIRGFPPAALVAFVAGLGQETFVGSSGRVFPRAMKASPLLRAWSARLTGLGVTFRLRQRWIGIDDDGRARFVAPDGSVHVAAPAPVVLALGGASWPRLGTDGAWTETVAAWGVEVHPMTAANAGALVAWSEHFGARFAGAPLKRVRLTVGEARARGEAMVTARGLEGGAVYALGPALRAALGTRAGARLAIDLRPDIDAATLAQRLERPRGRQSLATWLRKAAALSPVEIGLLREAAGSELPVDATGLAGLIKAVPLDVSGLAGLERAISSAGGIALHEVDETLMLRRRPGVFAAGEMLDWEAPTGGYLLQACFSSGHAAGRGVLRRLGRLA